MTAFPLPAQAAATVSESRRLGPRPLAACLAVVLGGAAVLATVVVTAAGMRVEPDPFYRFLALAAAMGVLAYWCHARSLDRRLGSAAAIVAAAIVSLMVCGVLANAGLRLGAPLADGRLAAADAVVGFDVGHVIVQVANSPLLTTVLAFLYNSSGIAVVLLIGWVLLRESVGKGWELAITAFISMQLVALSSPALPALGAMRHFSLEGLQGDGLPVGAGVYQWPAFRHFYNGTDPVLRLSDMGGVVAFPSFHTVLALMVTQALAETCWRVPAMIWTAGIILSAIPMGGHYVVDLGAGIVIWLIAAATAQRVAAQ